MTSKARHDPVSAIAESEASGETAAIFADIRKTMDIPLVTSIWRTLAGIEGGLAAAWAAARPLHATGQPAAALLRLRERVAFPVPEPLAPGQLGAAGVPPGDEASVRALLAAYNRSNGLNLLALSALVLPPAGTPPADPAPPSPEPWPKLPPLLTQADMSADTWTLIHHLNRLGLDDDPPGLATLWRHLSHWPGLLAVVHAGLAPLAREGRLGAATGRVLEVAEEEGARLAHLRPPDIAMPAEARAMIADYVGGEGLVARMVAIGIGLELWLADVAGEGR